MARGFSKLSIINRLASRCLTVFVLGASLTAQEQSNPPAGLETIPKFSWAPALGYVFVEGNCGTDDQTLGWMAAETPAALREAKLILFVRGDHWRTYFHETRQHFIKRWTERKGRDVIVVPGDHGRLRHDPVVVRVPGQTPYPQDSFAEAMYLQGYAGGFMDAANQRQDNEVPVTGPRGSGWQAGFAAAILSERAQAPAH